MTTIVELEFSNYSIVFQAIEKLMDEKESAVVAIDGMCGSGKSYLANLIDRKYDCNVFHMDDFFLPFEMKTKTRLAEPGGNVHYERFQDEVLNSLQKKECVTYKPYICSKRSLGDAILVKPKRLTVIEGSYSHHPKLKNCYDLKVFVKLNDKVQQDRILARNGEEKLQQFIEKWIPLEQHYFDALTIEEQSDIVLDTSLF